MKSLLIAITLAVLSTPASACITRGAVQLKNGEAALRAYEANSRSFGDCLKKIEFYGVDLSKARVLRKNRANGDMGPVIYTIMIQGKDKNQRQMRMSIQYSLRRHDFSCAEPTYNIPRCF